MKLTTTARYRLLAGLAATTLASGTWLIVRDTGDIERLSYIQFAADLRVHLPHFVDAATNAAATATLGQGDVFRGALAISRLLKGPVLEGLMLMQLATTDETRLTAESALITALHQVYEECRVFVEGTPVYDECQHVSRQIETIAWRCLPSPAEDGPDGWEAARETLPCGQLRQAVESLPDPTIASGTGW